MICFGSCFIIFYYYFILSSICILTLVCSLRFTLTGSFSYTEGNMGFQLHHAVHNMRKKPFDLFWRFRPSTNNFNDYIILQPNTRSKYTTQNKRQSSATVYTDTTVRRRPEETCRKKNRVGKIRQKIWIGTIAQALNSPSCEATKFKRIYPRWLKERYT